MNYEWIGKSIKKPNPKKKEKTVDINVKLTHVNKKSLARKRIFVQTPCSHYFKIREKFHAAKPLAFLLHFVLWREQNHYSNLTSKNIDRLMSEELLSDDRRVQKHLTAPGFEPLTSRPTARYTYHLAIRP